MINFILDYKEEQEKILSFEDGYEKEPIQKLEYNSCFY